MADILDELIKAGIVSIIHVTDTRKEEEGESDGSYGHL
jgi:hypothetical protein